MSKTKERAPKQDKVEKKRKRQEIETEDVPKKSKKSRKSEGDQDVPTSVEPVVEKKTSEEKKAEKEEKKKRKKERKEKTVAEADEQHVNAKESEEFIPLDNDLPMPNAVDNSDSKADKKKSKKEKKEKKAKKSKDSLLEDDDTTTEAEQNGVTESEAPATNGADAEPEASKKDKKSKKEKKEKKSKKPKANDEATTAEETTAETNGAATADEQDATEGAEEAEAEDGGSEKKGRFIVFVGNLPYTATKDSIAEHFEKLHPKEIRLRTYKGTEKFMGTCFIEFDRFDRMQTCLKKYHHSVFPDSKKKEGRKINVELSAGGGGNSENRKSRIVAKNDKLHDERARDRERRAELEMKQGERREKKEVGKKGGKEEADAEPETVGIHPARLAMMQAPQQRQRY